MFVFTARLPCDRRAAPLPCKFPSVSTPGFAESTFLVSRPCLCRLVGRLDVELVGPPTAFPVRTPVYRGCPAWTHRCATESRVTLWQRANPLLCVVGVVTSCVPCAPARGRTSRSCATENSYTPARLEAVVKLSVVTILSHSYPFHQILCGLWVLSPTRHLFRDLIGLFLLVVGSVAIPLIHANANLLLSR